jgi:protein phosphatase
MNRILLSGKTDPGRIRKTNEDAFALDEPKGYCLVADGIGGASYGEVASKIFADTARQLAAPHQDFHEETATLVAESVFQRANAAILAYADDTNSRQSGMGCTAELLVFFPGGYLLGHIGDSRTYRLRDGDLRQLTRDHSLRQEQLDMGLITPEELENHPHKNLITRAVGIEKNPLVDFARGSTRVGDLFLLCSDGLTDMVPVDDIRSVLNRDLSLDEQTERLVRMALDAGGRDNVTVVLARVTG